MCETISLTGEELKKIRGTLVETYETLSIQQGRISKDISELNYLIEKPFSQRIGIKGFSHAAIHKDGSIKIVVNRTPEKVKLFNRVGTQYYKEIKDFWEGTILNALREVTFQKFTDKAYIIIKICHSGNDWDIDNHNIKFIVDAIRYSGVIKNDTFRDVTYAVEGEESQEEKTFIYILNGEQYVEYLKNNIQS